MVTIIKRNIKGKEYKYLSYTYRKNGKVLKMEKYLGLEIPPYEDLIQIWEKFSYEIVKERWIPIINKMIKNYHEIFNSMPLSAQIKNLRNFGIRFTHHSNKIEGSSLSLRDVEAIVDDNILPKNKLANDAIEAKAHMIVYEKMIQCTKELSMNLICKWHEELFSLTKPNEAGIIRNYPVGISGSNYIPPESREEILMLLNDLFKWYNKNKIKFHPVFITSIMHYRFVYIHPFGDGNGRMVRLFTNYILYKNKFPMFDIDSNIRFQYYNALEKSDKKDYEFPFIQWYFKNYIKANQKYVKK